MLEAEFTIHRIDLVATEWFVREDQVEWEKPDDPVGQHMVEQARETGEIVFGEFHAWGHDAPDATN